MICLLWYQLYNRLVPNASSAFNSIVKLRCFLCNQHNPAMAYERFTKLGGEKQDRMIKATIGMSRAKFDRLAADYNDRV